MAVFNPEVDKTNDPSYLGLSKPISPLEGDKSNEFLFKGIGNFIEGAVGVADAYVKADIDQQVYQTVDAEKDAYTQALEITREGVSGKPLDMFTDQMPADLESIDGYLTAIKNSRELGVVPESYYKGKIDTYARELRSKYPGYRQYIDQKFSQATGMNVANAYLESQTAEINRYMGNLKTERNKVQSLLMQNIEIPGANVVIEKYMRGEMSDSEAMGWVSSRLSEKWDLQMRKARREEFTGTREAIKGMAEDDLHRLSSTTAANYWQTLQISQGVKTPQDAQKLLDDMRTGKITINSQDGIEIARAIKGGRDTTFNYLWKQANEADARGFSMVQRVGEKRAKEIIDSHLIVFDTAIQGFSKGDLSIAANATEMQKAITAQDKYNLIRHQDVGGRVRALLVMEGMGPDAVGAWSRAAVGDPNWTSGITQYFQTMTSKMSSNQSMLGRTDNVATETFVPPTLKRVIQQSQADGVNDPKFYRSLVNFTKVLGMKDVPDVMKINIAKNTFDPNENRAVLDFIPPDSRDPKTGRVIPGRVDAFRTMTSPEITKEMYRLGQREPSVWKNYVEWAQESFALDIFQRDLKDLENLQGQEHLNVTFDPETNNFDVTAKIDTSNPFNLTTDIRMQSAKAARDIITRLNVGLNSISEIAKIDGKDPTEYLLRVLSINYNPQSSQGSTIPEKMWLEVQSKRRASLGDDEPMEYSSTGKPRASSPTQVVYSDVESTGLNLTPELQAKARTTVNAATISPEWGNPFDPEFKRNHIVKISTASGHEVEVNKYAARAFEGFLNELEQMGYPIKEIGGHSHRTQKNVDGTMSNRISQHAFGNAIDINPRKNPFGPKLKTDLPPNVGQIAAKWGLSWGGNWKGAKDAMHFEYTGVKGS